MGMVSVVPHEQRRSSRSSPMLRPLSIVPKRGNFDQDSGEIDRPQLHCFIRFTSEGYDAASESATHTKAAFAHRTG
jgi:hypothetical protein